MKRQYCDDSNERPEWEDLPEKQLEIIPTKPTEDANNRRIEELEQRLPPWLIPESVSHDKIEKLMN